MEITSEQIHDIVKQSDSEIKEFVKNAKAGAWIVLKRVDSWQQEC